MSSDGGRRPYFASAPLLVAGALASAPLLSVALLSLSFGCVQFVDATYWAATMRIAGTQSRTATGMMNSGGNISGGVGALLVPVIAGRLGWLGIRADVPLQNRTAPENGAVRPIVAPT
jgi:hypothetical protein